MCGFRWDTNILCNLMARCAVLGEGTRLGIPFRTNDGRSGGSGWWRPHLGRVKTVATDGFTKVKILGI